MNKDRIVLLKFSGSDLNWSCTTGATKQNLRILKQLKSYKIYPLTKMKLNYKSEKSTIIWKLNYTHLNKTYFKIAKYFEVN